MEGHRHKGKDRGGEAHGLQGAVGAVQYLGEWWHGLSLLMGPCWAKDALGGSITLSAMSSLTQILCVAAQTHRELATIIPLEEPSRNN